MTRNLLRSVLREPLVHFLAAGAILFAAFEFISGDDAAGPERITVGKPQLIQFVSHRNPRLGPEGAAAYLDDLDKAQLEELISRYVHEEVLYREAKALGLGQNDYSARRRLITQLEYINQGFIAERLQFTNEDLVAWYADHRDRYHVPAKITFTHVFFSTREGDTEAARRMATTKLTTLNTEHVAFHQAGRHGQRFLYHRNYVNKTREEIASHFGEAFARRVFSMQATERQWVGPFESEFGYHLVLPGGYKQGYYPPLTEVRDRVLADAKRARIDTELTRFYENAKANYEIDATMARDETP